MITREILEAQLLLYQNGQRRAVDELEKAKANLNACGGAIEACQSLLRILTDLEDAKNPKDDAKKKAGKGQQEA